jgi:histidinol-phosphate phosphatase family protein
LAIKQAIVIAGGKGTRLGSLSNTRPKALVNIAGRPLIEHQLSVAKRYGIERFLILTGFLGEVLAEFLGTGESFGIKIKYRQEIQPLGTAGALKNAEDLLDEQFFVFYGDVIFDVDLYRLVEFHARKSSAATLVVHPNDHPQDSDLIETDGDDRIIAFHPKHRPPATIARNLVNAGIYLLAHETLRTIDRGKFADFGLDVFPRMLKDGQILTAYNTPEYIKDVGTPERLAFVERDVVAGKIARRNLSLSQSAVFIDRDGVLIEEKGDCVTHDQGQLLPGTALALRRLNQSDFVSIVATNQPGIAKGRLSESDVARVHAQIDTMLGNDHSYINEYLVCPHHPDRGFAGERSDLKIICECRKPRPGMLLDAAKRLNISLARSFLVGDRTVDIAAGHNAGVCAIGVRTGYGCTDCSMDANPDFICDDLYSAVSLILDHESLLDPVAQLAERIAARPGTMLAVGGLSRAGKSVFVQLLMWQLRRRQCSAEILHLDDYLRPEQQRKQISTVLDRYDTSQIGAVIKRESARRDTVLIVDGVISLAMPIVRYRAGWLVYISIDEQVRRKRFVEAYKGRGFSEPEADALYNGRDAEERATISASSVHANIKITCDPGKQ